MKRTPLTEPNSVKSESKFNVQVKLSQNTKGARYKSESVSTNPNPDNLIKRDPLTDPNSVINDPMKTLTEMVYLKSEPKFNDQVKLSQNTKGARYKSESVSINLNPINPIKRVPGTEPKSVINDSDQTYKSRSSHKLFILDQISVMKLSLEKQGIFHEPGKYSFLLLIIFYLLSFSHKPIMHKNERGESNYLPPTKNGTSLIQTSPGICWEN